MIVINPSIYVEVRLNSDVFVRPTVADVYTAARVESYTFRQLPTRAITAMTRDGLGAYRLWGRDDDERTPLVSREGCVRQALRVGNIPRIALIGLIGIVALACMGGVISHAPARRDSEVETEISSALGSFMESPVHNEMMPATEPTNGDVATLGGKSYAYVFAHMVNHKSLVDWALGQGANGVEIDLTFSGGNPTEFRHGAPCDCTCKLTSTKKNVCKQDLPDKKRTCLDGTGIDDMLEHLATKTNLAMVYIDSKTGSITGDKNKAGENVGNKLITNLFRKGFKGAVTVGSPDTDGTPYLKGVNSVIAGSEYKNRVYYTMDMVRDGASKAINALVGISPYRVYGTGVSVCAPGTYYDEIAVAAANAAQGTLSMAPTIWTLDSSSSMKKYLSSGARSIMTNTPADAAAAFREAGIALSHVGDFPPPATNDKLFDGLLDDGAECKDDDKCRSGACARKTAADGEKTKCCKQGESKVRYPKVAGFDYCTGMPDGAVCWLDKMCKSKSCKGNSLGTSKGKCSKK